MDIITYYEYSKNGRRVKGKMALFQEKAAISP